MSKVVGIDLGTTNSLIAYMEGGSPRVIPDQEGHRLIPSVLSFQGDAPVIVGEAAKKKLLTEPLRTLYSIKRLMGRGLSDLRDDLHLIPFHLSEEQEVIRVQVGDKRYTPPELSAFVLKALKNQAEQFLGEPIRQTVITVPAHFNDSQRQATKDAGRIAGLEVLRILNEPTAAALAYGLQKKKEGTIVVYDLGGGTFDVSILKIRNGIFEVLSTNGNTHLGGDDLDRRLMRIILNDIVQLHNVDLVGIPEALQEVRLIAERVKCELSESLETEIAFSFPAVGVVYNRKIKRSEWEGWVKDLVERTLPPCRDALSDAGLTAAQVDEVILVGGSTRIPLVKEKVTSFFGKTPHSELNPDEVVALGAAVQADILSGGITQMLLLDITPLSLGIETMGGVVSCLIARNSTLPTSAQETFTTSVDGQTGVSIHVVQGERPLVQDCRSLARFNLHVNPMPAGMARIEVTFLIDANGILNVSAEDTRTGTIQSIEVKPSYGLTDREVEVMVLASIEHEQEDTHKRTLIEVRKEGESLVGHVERALVQVSGDDRVIPSETAEITERLSTLKGVMKGKDPKQIREAIGQLEKATHPLAEFLMNKTLKDALENKKRVDV